MNEEESQEDDRRGGHCWWWRREVKFCRGRRSSVHGASALLGLHTELLLLLPLVVTELEVHAALLNCCHLMVNNSNCNLIFLPIQSSMEDQK